MVVISIAITASEEQVIAGIPRTVTVTTNVPASIFYTLDGTDPTLFSNIYTDIIRLPYDQLSVTLKVLATDGVNNSPIVFETYTTNMVSNARLPRSGTDVAAGTNLQSLYPFGTNTNQPLGNFINPAEVGITVDNPELARSPTAYDGEGNPAAYTNLAYTSENYSIRYSTTDSIGQTGAGIGNLPANTSILEESAAPNETQQFSNTFDPKAFVIFQDFSQENPNDPVHINRQFFTLENSERARDGNHFYNSGLDAPPVSGSFLRSHYNPRDNTITYYYLDSSTNKWIISKTPYQPNGSFDGNLSGVALSKNSGAGFVFEWRPFARRVLF
jgi:hypothetical protein